MSNKRASGRSTMDMLNISASLLCILSHQALRIAVIADDALHTSMPVRMFTTVRCG